MGLSTRADNLLVLFYISEQETVGKQWIRSLEDLHRVVEMVQKEGHFWLPRQRQEFYHFEESDGIRCSQDLIDDLFGLHALGCLQIDPALASADAWGLKSFREYFEALDNGAELYTDYEHWITGRMSLSPSLGRRLGALLFKDLKNEDREYLQELKEKMSHSSSR